MAEAIFPRKRSGIKRLMQFGAAGRNTIMAAPQSAISSSDRDHRRNRARHKTPRRAFGV
jgi:hypothetical protein